jgi:quercetin dioxygenase-like cupin family protein
MIRTLAAALAVVAVAGHAQAQGVHNDPHISCRLLLPSTEIPDNPGHLVSIREITVFAGNDGHRHWHGAIEYVTVVSGEGSISIDGQPDVPLTPGTVVTVPWHARHQLHNHSATNALIFFTTFLETSGEHEITTYIGEPDTVNGCPPRIR